MWAGVLKLPSLSSATSGDRCTSIIISCAFVGCGRKVCLQLKIVFEAIILLLAVGIVAFQGSIRHRTGQVSFACHLIRAFLSPCIMSWFGSRTRRLMYYTLSSHESELQYLRDACQPFPANTL